MIFNSDKKIAQAMYKIGLEPLTSDKYIFDRPVIT